MTMQQWLDKYGESHQNHTNKLIHWICVPTIFFSVLGLLWSIPHGFLMELFPFMGNFANFATVFCIACSIFYLRLSIPIFLGMIVIAIVFLSICNWIDTNFSTPLWIVSLTIFVIAWIGQFIGHKIEGEKPSFIDDLKFLLIGPAWLLSFVFSSLGIKY
jgi:uncharacterized membrane protein YGL010W